MYDRTVSNQSQPEPGGNVRFHRDEHLRCQNNNPLSNGVGPPSVALYRFLKCAGLGAADRSLSHNLVYFLALLVVSKLYSDLISPLAS